MIPVYIHDVVVNEEKETYLVLLKSDLELEGTVPVNLGPISALDLHSKVSDDVEDQKDLQSLLPELLEETDAAIDTIRIDRDPTGRYRANVSGSTESSRHHEDQRNYEIELSDALALAAETSARLEVPPDLLQNIEMNAEDRERNVHNLEKISKLRYELQEALENEDYEQADEIKSRLNTTARRLEQATETDENIEEELKRAYFNGED